MATDRHGRELKIGQIVEIQHCVGRYGQTRIEEGEITHFGLGGVTLDGWKWVTIAPNGYHKHDDIEHGHEIWTEIVEDA